MMGYAIDATKAAHVTVFQRTMRLGQAMDANTMRWFGAFLFATQLCVTTSGDNNISGGGFTVKRCKLTHQSRAKRENSYDLTKFEDHHHQACAVVEQLLSLERSFPTTSLGGGDTQNERKSMSKLHLRKQIRSTITIQKNRLTLLNPSGRLEQHLKREIN